MNILKRDQLEWKLRAAFSYGTDFYALIGSNCKWTFLSIHLWIIVIIFSIFHHLFEAELRRSLKSWSSFFCFLPRVFWEKTSCIMPIKS